MDSQILTNLLLARLQMAFTLGVHIVFACLGVGLPVLMLAAEGLYLRTGQAGWKELARRWSKAFGLLFAVGAASGTAISFELGLLWPGWVGVFGGVIGPAFTLEGFPFFFEALFLGLYVYGWDRLGKKAHWISGFPVALAGLASAWVVTTVNAWMNSPAGFDMKEGVVTATSPWAAIFNPAMPVETLHMILSAYMVAGFGVAAVYAWFRLRGDRSRLNRRALWLALALGCLVAPLQVVVGDQSGKSVARLQPIKLAAMEGNFETRQGAPLSIGGIPLPSEKRMMGGLDIAKMLSFLAYGYFDAQVKGLNDYPPDQVPPVTVVHAAFHAMVGAGFFLAALALGFLLGARIMPGILEHKIFLLAVLASGPLAVLALETGWIVTEVGRQPWIVYGIQRTAEAVTRAPIAGLFAASLVFYLCLVLATIFGLVHLSRQNAGSGGGHGL